MNNNKFILALLVVVTTIINIPYTASASTSIISTRLDSCQGNVDCINKILTSSLTKNNLKERLSAFSYLVKNNKLDNTCARVGNALGSTTYKNKINVEGVYLEDCGHSFIYGFMREAGGVTNGFSYVDKFVKYCLGDPNPPSCSYGVGIAIGNGKAKPVEADRFCMKFNEYDKNKPKTQSYQMTAVGDCIFGWASQRSATFTEKDYESITAALSKCTGIKMPYIIVCESENLSQYTTMVSSDKIKIKRLYEVRDFCLKSKDFECMQFVGKITDSFMLKILKISDNNKSDLKKMGDFMNSVCNNRKKDACLTGFVQSRIVESSKSNTLNICTYLMGLRRECEKIAGNHG